MSGKTRRERREKERGKVAVNSLNSALSLLNTTPMTSPSLNFTWGTEEFVKFSLADSPRTFPLDYLYSPFTSWDLHSPTQLFVFHYENVLPLLSRLNSNSLSFPTHSLSNSF